MKRLVMVLLFSALVVGCGDQRTATAPPGSTAQPGGIVAAISDGAHSGGNPDFFFRPPLVGNPVSDPNFDSGKFNPGLRPVVRVFRLLDGCTSTGTPVYGPFVAAVNAGEEQYQLDWNTKASTLDPLAVYRICVFSSSAGTVLGFLDVEPIAGGMKNARTGDTYVFQDDRTLPIKFRIEFGALCADHVDRVNCAEFPAVTSTGGDFTLPPDQQGLILAGVHVPPGAVGPNDVVTIVIQKEAPLYGEGDAAQCLPTGLVQSKWCYHFSTEPALYHFLTDVRLEACVDPSSLPEEQAAALDLYKYNAEQGLVHLTPAEPQLIECTPPSVGDARLPAPANLAEAVWRGAGRLFAKLVGPSELFAATIFGTPPTGLGGLGGSFSDVGGAVPSSAPQAPVLLTVPAAATVGQTGLVATASGGSGTGAFFYASSTPAVCTVNAGTGSLTLLTAGTCSLTATKAGDEIYKATSAVGSFPVAAQAQTINFAQPASPATFGTTFTVSPTASSGLVVTVTPTGGCSITEGTVTMTSGTVDCVLTASQAGNASYAAAPDVVRTVAASKAAQDPVTLTGPADANVGQTGLTAVASGGSGTGAYRYFSSTYPVCTVDSTTGSIRAVSSGTCSLTATKAADANYLAATSAPQSFTVAASQAPQATVMLAVPAYGIVGQTGLVAYASGGSGTGAYSYASSTLAVCTVDAGTGAITTIAVGQCSLTAIKAGDENWLESGPSAVMSFPVAVLHFQGLVAIPQTFSADLDEGVVSDPGPPSSSMDIWFHAVTATVRYLEPINGATLAVSGSTPPGLRRCIDLTLSTVRIDMTALPVNTWVCVRTNGGRISEVGIQEAPGPSPGLLVIGVKTWTF